MIKRYSKLSLLLLLLFLFFACKQEKDSHPTLKLWYDKPASEWMTSALPIGNGELGGMFFGGVPCEHIQFNEKTLWTGSPSKRGSYQNFGDLFINFSGHKSAINYHRELDLAKAIGSVSYECDNIHYLREYFASHPDSVIVMRFSSDKKKKVSLDITLKDAHTGTIDFSTNRIIMTGKLDLLTYEAQVLIQNEGGRLEWDGIKAIVENADAVTLLLTGSTNYDITSSNYIGKTEKQLHHVLTDRVVSASEKTYSELKKAHLDDYQSLFNRVVFDLKTQIPIKPTDKLIRENKDNIYLDMLYFQYGRYLMISSSRGRDLPSNLQGIWNNNNTPPWESDIHTNINVQMNYWPAESTNLSECHLPFINYVKIEALKENGSFQKVAMKENNRGWALHTQCNIFGYTDWYINRPANAWYCIHLWQHYIYTNDINYLKSTAFPVMKNACEYWFDRLKEGSDGRLIAPDEWSPEQGSWEDGVAYAQQLIGELFNNTLKAAELVNANTEFILELSNKLSRLDNGLKIGEWGQIKEWKFDKSNLDIYGNNHRHLSQLMALYPGTQISYLKDSILADAAQKTLESRGDEGMGWSRAWKIACWARLFDGNHAYKLLKQALNITDKQNLSMDVADGGVYENLLDAHPPFQIDGNFGATADITEMLLQSHLGEIHLLPALPNIWGQGEIKGLKASGNFLVDIKWANNQLIKAEITSLSGKLCVVRTAQPMSVKGKHVIKQDGKYYLNTFPTKKGGKYKLYVKQ